MGHFYDRDGTPRYYVIAKNGNSRDTTIADARKNGWLPSVTEIIKVIDKPQLTNWKIDQAILAALTLPRGAEELEADWLKRVKSDSYEQVKVAAEEGNRIHEAIEQSYAGTLCPDKYGPHVAATLQELARLFPGVTDWVSEASFGSELGFGGKVDLHSPSTGIVVDFKGKDGDFTDGKKLAYDQHWQLAAYQTGLKLPRNVCANLFVSRTHPGRVASHVWPVEDVEEGWGVFYAALRLWARMRGFNPMFTRETA
jgi:hypothetical protein